MTERDWVADQIVAAGRATTVRVVDQEKVLADTERHIQRILMELCEVTGARIQHVNVDTRNFANYGVEIFLTNK